MGNKGGSVTDIGDMNRDEEKMLLDELFTTVTFDRAPEDIDDPDEGDD